MATKNYRQDGLSSSVELGKGGARVRDNSGVIEARNNADSALAVFRAADPITATDVVTKQYLLANGNVTVIGNIYDVGATTPGSTQFTSAAQDGFIAICNETVTTFTAGNLYRLDEWNTDAATSTWTEIVASEGLRFVMSDVSSGGSPVYAADHVYIYDLDGTVWVDVGPAAAASAIIKSLRSALVFGTSSPLAIGTPAANSVITKIIVKVTTAFNGTAPLLDIGIAGTTDLYMDRTEIDLNAIGTYIVNLYELDGAGTAMIGTYAADSSTAGAASIFVEYSLI